MDEEDQKRVVSSQAQKYQVVTRAKWESQVPLRDEMLKADDNFIPYKNVLLRDIVGTKVCTSFYECITTMQKLEKADVQRGLAQIQYNFVVGADLKVYTGRGWFMKPSVPDEFQDIADSTLYIGFIGDYSRQSPPFITTFLALKTISHGLDKGYIAPTFNLIQLKKTSKTI